jgi:hypothetical protein
MIRSFHQEIRVPTQQIGGSTILPVLFAMLLAIAQI